MIVTEEDLNSDKGLKDKICSLCSKEFQVGESFEKIMTHRKSKLILHTDCIKKGL